MPPKNTDTTADQRSTLVDDDEASIATHFEEAQVTQMDALGMKSAVIYWRTRNKDYGIFSALRKTS